MSDGSRYEGSSKAIFDTMQLNPRLQKPEKLQQCTQKVVGSNPTLEILHCPRVRLHPCQVPPSWQVQIVCGVSVNRCLSRCIKAATCPRCDPALSARQLGRTAVPPRCDAERRGGPARTLTGQKHHLSASKHHRV